MNYFCSIYDDEEWVRQVYEDKVAQTIKRVAIKSGPAAKKIRHESFFQYL